MVPETGTTREQASPDQHRIHRLARRLATGWALIDTTADPDERSRLETHWIELLRDYVDACDGATGDAAVPR